MQYLPQIELARRALRGTICPTCYQRPSHSEALAPTIARSCEPQCPVFKYIDRLMAVARASAANAATHDDLAILDDVCNKRCTAPTAGDYCSERLRGTCPLSLFAGQAIAVLQTLFEAETRTAHVHDRVTIKPDEEPASSPRPADDPCRWKGLIP